MMKNEICIIVLIAYNIFNLYLMIGGLYYSLFPFIICSLAIGLNYIAIKHNKRIKLIDKKIELIKKKYLEL